MARLSIEQHEITYSLLLKITLLQYKIYFFIQKFNILARLISY